MLRENNIKSTTALLLFVIMFFGFGSTSLINQFANRVFGQEECAWYESCDASQTETPVEESPPAETPVEESPPAETPVEESPPAETPVEESPPAETPVEEGTVNYCYPSTEACSASSVLLSDDGNILCDPAQYDCSQYLNPQQVSPTDQSNTGGPLPEFEWLTKGNPDAGVLQATDPPGQYCNPRAETCDAATYNPGGCMIDITTHGDVCDYSGTSTEYSGNGEDRCDPSVTTCLPTAILVDADGNVICDPHNQDCSQYHAADQTTTPTPIVTPVEGGVKITNLTPKFCSEKKFTIPLHIGCTVACHTVTSLACAEAAAAAAGTEGALTPLAIWVCGNKLKSTIVCEQGCALAGDFICETVEENLGSESPGAGAGGAPPDAGAPDASAGGAPPDAGAPDASAGGAPPDAGEQQTPDNNEGPLICQEPSEPNQSVEQNICQ